MSYQHYVLLLLGLLVAFPAEHDAARVKRILGGEVYNKGDYPFHVSLWYMGDNNPYTANTPDMHHTCAGSLINMYMVLTAASCFDDNFLPGIGDLTKWRVALGMYGQRDAEKEAQFRSISEIYIAPNYNLTSSYGNLAVIKLSAPAEFDPNVGMVMFNRDLECPATGDRCTVIGWGQISEEPYGYGSEYPYSVDVPIVDVDSCSQIYSDLLVQAEMGPITIDGSNICAGGDDQGKDACFGDAGGPLLCSCKSLDGISMEMKVVGTVSTGFGCGRTGYPGVYTRVSAYVDWLYSVAAKVMENVL